MMRTIAMPPIMQGDPLLTRDVRAAVRGIIERRSRISNSRSMLVGISGIDGSGKGFVSAIMQQQLEANGQRIALIRVDDWVQLPDKRFDPTRPAEHFYESGLRLDEMFERLVLPLRAQRSIRLDADHADSTNRSSYRRYTYDHANVDVILVEGIFLFKRRFISHYDMMCWVDCTFETALERAVARKQENLPPDETIRDYRTIYYPAQRLHFAIDRPRESAEHMICNDPRLAGREIRDARGREKEVA